MKKMLLPLTFFILLATTSFSQTITINTNVISPTCNGSSDGSISLNVSGGMAPYTYVWSPAILGGSPNVTNIGAGNYSVTVTDANALSQIANIVITQPSAISINGSVTNTSSPSATDGSITVNVSGGTPAYTYNWSFGPITTPTVNNLAVGTYTVTVVDANGCSNTDNFFITSQSPAPANLILTELMYNPPESGTDSLEFIEILNAGNTPVNLNGYSFTQGVTHTFGNDTIAAGQYFIIAVDSGAFRNVFGIDADAIWTSGGLSNSGEDITIVDANGVMIDSVNYDDNLPWPSGSGAFQPDGGGTSIELINSTSDNNDGNNWKTSTSATLVTINGFQVFASPGARGFITTLTEMSANSSDFTFYPNPASDVLKITLETSNLSSTLVEIFSISGQNVKSFRLNQTTQEVFIGDLDNGIYFLKYENKMRKLLVNR